MNRLRTPNERRNDGLADALEKDAVIEVEVELEGVQPRVFRHFTVRASLSLHQLHNAIQAVMGWENRHLYMFDVHGVLYGEPDPEMNFKNSRRLFLRDLFESRMRYTYDFGDDWHHRVTLSAPRNRQPNEFVPRLLAAEGTCPPEDVGGHPGYAHFLDVLANPRDPEHLDYLEWAGGSWDPVDFSPEPLQYALVTTARRGRWVIGDRRLSPGN